MEDSKQQQPGQDNIPLTIYTRTKMSAKRNAESQKQRGIVKLFTKLSPHNGMGGVSIFYGKLYHMKYDRCEGYQRDIKSLYEIIENVLLRLPPEDGSSETWQVRRRDLMQLYKDSHLKGLDNFLFDLKNFDKQKKKLPWYCPFFWSQKERFYFMENVYDIFWVEKNLRPKNVKYEVEEFFSISWLWWDLVPEGPYRRMWPSVQAAIVHRIDMVGREKPKRKQCDWSNIEVR
ncbi:hypothetical protein K1719_003501 [Acacia pycnantha]|nr:hypothetical protein K1719_003501 [Acacia pycnantha]